jgi:hypothetical protein
VCREYTAQRFADLEGRARERELALIDSYLRKQNVPPLEVQRENVLKLPDPESVRPGNFVDEAVRLNQISEIVEEARPEAAWLTADEIRAQLPELWSQAEKQWELERTALRV